MKGFIKTVNFEQGVEVATRLRNIGVDADYYNNGMLNSRTYIIDDIESQPGKNAWIHITSVLGDKIECYKCDADLAE